MKQADTYLEIKAECPHCGYIDTPDWVDDNCSQSNTRDCESCKKEFSYTHPDNQYGLAK